MKHKFRIYCLIVCCGIFISGCNYDKSTEIVKEKERIDSSNINNLADTANFYALIDLYNVRISRYALASRPDTLALLFFDSLLSKKPDIQYNGILQAIPERKSNNRELCTEINNLKTSPSVLKLTNNNAAQYLTMTVFQDTQSNQNLFNFYDTRSQGFEADRLHIFLGKLGNEIDAICRQKKIFKASAMQYNVLKAVVFFLVIGIPLIAWFMIRQRRRQGKPSGNLNSTSNAKIKKEGKDKHSRDDEGISDQEFHDAVSKRESKTPQEKIEGLEKEIRRLKVENNSLQNKLSDLESNKHIAEKIENLELKQVQTNAEITSVYYFPPPNNDRFPIATGSEEKRTYDAFKIQVKKGRAYFRLLIEDTAVMKRAIESSEKYILPVCEIDPKSAPFGKASKIEIVSEGVLTREGDSWKLNEKSVIKLI